MKIVSSILLASAALLYVNSSVAAIKCWTNHEGYRECGNYIPPEFAQQESRTLNERGVTTEIRKRAKTREEAQEERRIAQEKRRKEEKERKTKEERATHDRVLLSTFLSGEDIHAARDRKLSSFDGYLEITQITIANLKKKLEDEQRKVANSERSGQPVSAASMKQIRAFRNQISIKEAFARQKQAEKDKLRKKYDDDYKRFMELKAMRR